MTFVDTCFLHVIFNLLKLKTLIIIYLCCPYNNISTSNSRHLPICLIKQRKGKGGVSCCFISCRCLSIEWVTMNIIVYNKAVFYLEIRAGRKPIWNWKDSNLQWITSHDLQSCAKPLGLNSSINIELLYFEDYSLQTWNTFLY